MTVSSSTSTASYVGSDQSVLPLTFRFFDDGEINFYRVDPLTGASTLQVLGVDYTLTGAGEPEVNGNATGTIVLTAPLATGTNGFAERVLDAVQNTDLVNQGRFFAEVHEDAYDYLTMLVQQLVTAVNNTIKTVTGGFGWDFLGKRGLNVGSPIDPTDAATKGYVDAGDSALATIINGLNGKALRVPENVPSLPNAAGRADKLLSFDSSGNPIAVAAANQSATDLELRLANSSDPVKGAGMVGWTRSSLSSAIDNVHEMLDAQAVNIWEFAGLVTSKPTPADPNTWDWFPAMVAAHALGDVAYPSGRFKCSGTVDVKPGSRLQGVKGGRFEDSATRTIIECTTAGAVLFDQVSTATGQVDGFRAYDALLIADIPIRLNDPTTTISTGGPSPFIMRPEFRRISFQKKTPSTGHGLLMSKCFDWSVEDCDFDGFARGLVLQGCDLGRAAHNRFTAHGEYAILELSTGTFGSQNEIEHNDMVGMNAGGIFIKTTGRHVRVRDNYMEQSSGSCAGFVDASSLGVPQYGANAVSTTRNATVDIDDNRIDGMSLATSFVYRYEPGTSTDVKIHDGGTSGSAPAAGVDTWLKVVGDLLPLHFNTTNMCKYSIHGGRGADGFPFNLFESRPLKLNPSGWYFDAESLVSLRRGELVRNNAHLNVRVTDYGIVLLPALGTTFFHCVLPAANGLNNPYLRAAVNYTVKVTARCVSGTETLRVINVVDAAAVGAATDIVLDQQSKTTDITITGAAQTSTIGMAFRFQTAVPAANIIIESVSFERA